MATVHWQCRYHSWPVIPPWLASSGWSNRRSKIWTNITLSLTIKLVFLTLAVTGETSLWMAILAYVGISLVVIVNGMLLLRWNSDEGPGPASRPA